MKSRLRRFEAMWPRIPNIGANKMSNACKHLGHSVTCIAVEAAF